jgi:amino acid transporter
LLAAAALLIDYVLVVAIGVSAGVGAVVSAVPALQPYTLLLCLGTLALIALVNLRGVRESGIAFTIPTYVFIACMLFTVALGVAKSLLSGGQPKPVTPPPELQPAEVAVSVGLLLHAFAAGCTALTGVEAISNGVTVFRAPTVRYAHRTLSAVIGIVAILLAGIAYLTRAYGIGATEPGAPGYESVLSQLIGAVIGRGGLYYISMAAIMSVLVLSANSGFAGFPRVTRVIAQDDFWHLCAVVFRGCPVDHVTAGWRARSLVMSHSIRIQVRKRGTQRPPNRSSVFKLHLHQWTMCYE